MKMIKIIFLICHRGLIQGHCLSLEKWEPLFALTTIDFTKIQFWVQIHDFGLEIFSTENARRIGVNIGEYVETNKEVRIPIRVICG